MTWPARALAALSLLATMLLSALHASRAMTIDYLSFGDRYEKADENGRRVVSEYFVHGGDADIKKNFIRLTPDRQSKRGYIWSRGQTDRRTLVSVVTFRVHGQGRRWFGDGIGIWLTQARQFQPGDNHGFTDQYTGVGIVLDTFRNTEHRGGHKDVTVQINDGRKTLDQLNNEAKIGCDADFRYYSKSASFDPVYSTSRIRISIDHNHLKLELDAESTGMWQDCYTGDLPFEGDWLRHATVGITASTGALADNHDIIKLASFDAMEDSGVYEHDSEMWSHHFSKEYDNLINSENCDQGCKINIMNKFVSNFEKEMEHWFEDLKESTENTLAKLREQEKRNEARIDALRLTNVVERSVSKKMYDVKNRVHGKMNDNVKEKIVATQSSWRVPFFILVVALAALTGVAYKKYRKLVKTHLI